MSGSLTHSPADIVRNLLVKKSLGTTPSANGSWPVYAVREPDLPDNAITVYNTTARINGRTMPDSERQEHHGIQVRVRSQDPVTGYTKARALAIALDNQANNASVTISSSVYVVSAITRTTDVIDLNKEVPTSKRNIYTINAVAALHQTS